MSQGAVGTAGEPGRNGNDGDKVCCRQLLAMPVSLGDGHCCHDP